MPGDGANLVPQTRETYLMALDRLETRESVADVVSVRRSWSSYYDGHWGVTLVLNHRYPLDHCYWDELERNA